MKLFIFVIACWGIVQSSPVERLRGLFATVKQFATGSVTIASTQDTDRIVRAAVQYTNGEGRALDHLVDILTVVGSSGLSPKSLDSIAWNAAASLLATPQTTRIETIPTQEKAEKTPIVSTKLEERTTPTQEKIEERSETKPIVLTKVEDRTTPTQEKIEERTETNSIETQPKETSSTGQSRPGKRSLERADRDELKQKIIEILEPFFEDPDVQWIQHEGARYLNYRHFRMVERGELDEILSLVEKLKLVYPYHVASVFELAFEKLKNDAYKIREDRLQSFEVLFERRNPMMHRRATRESLIAELAPYCKKEYKTPHRALAAAAHGLLNKAKAGDLQQVHSDFLLYDFAGVSKVKIGSMFSKVYNFLVR